MQKNSQKVQNQQSVWITVAASVISSVLCVFLLNQFVFKQEESIAPPILIVDYAQVLKDLPQDEEESDRIMIKTSELIARFHDAGFLVLDAQNVIAAPSELYLPQEAIYE